ncbi:sulfotransferase [Dapis sp. BLCC M229]|uniref:sulfotransferase n=1 Tax=Dapis sp. BLCC M229 TaxID=3400188 RepID=UPI003CF7F861
MSLNFQSVLIVTYGRSGSTLLQGILNNIDGVLVRGENNNFIYGLYEAYKKLIDTHNQKKTSQANHPWYGAGEINLELFLDYCQEMVRNILLADKKHDQNILCYGFKEIRYFEVYQQQKDIADYLDFLAKIFPTPAFIFNVRNLDDVLKSGWWANTDRAESITELMNLETAFHTYKTTHPENTFIISYEDVVSESNNFKLLFDFLGAKYPENIDKILLTPHSYGQKNIQTYQNFLLKLTPASLYSHLFSVCEIDNVPNKILPGEEFNLAGVVIPTNNQISISAIYTIYSGKIISAELGLSSPVYGEKYPAVKVSKNARFKFYNIILSESAKLNIFVEINNRQKVEIATLYIS